MNASFGLESGCDSRVRLRERPDISPENELQNPAKLAAASVVKVQSISGARRKAVTFHSYKA